eukprot:CCRYP_019775-RA/>CCRYP_019775-RA protein AED:0.41 eAED:0.41 QI:0/0/0/1/1/1/2/0/216
MSPKKPYKRGKIAVAVISGTADKFPLHLWCQLIPHMERQLNLLRQSNANPKISAYAHLYGPHDYNAAPFVPLGMEALVHDKPHRRKTSPNTAQEVGSSAHQPSTTGAGRYGLPPPYLTNPSVTPTDALIAAAANLAHIIKHNAKAQHVGTKNLLDLQRLQQLFSGAAQQPPGTSTATAGTSNCRRTRRYSRPTSKGANTTAYPHGLAAALHQPRYL